MLRSIGEQSGESAESVVHRIRMQVAYFRYVEHGQWLFFLHQNENRSYCNQKRNNNPLNSTNYSVLYPQNIDRIPTIDFMWRHFIPRELGCSFCLCSLIAAFCMIVCMYSVCMYSALLLTPDCDVENSYSRHHSQELTVCGRRQLKNKDKRHSLTHVGWSDVT